MARKTFLNGYPLPASDLNTYLMDQTVQTFADAAARTAALATPTEGMQSYLADTNTVYSFDGTNWVAQIDAANYGTMLPNGAAGRNKIINGDFGIWARGTTSTASGYLADRFTFAGTSTFTQSRQTFTPGTAPVAGYEGQYYYNLTLTSNNQNSELIHRVEDARTFAGQTVTFSFWARSTVGAQLMNVNVYQHFGTGGSPSSLVQVLASTYTPTSTWTRYTFTATFPSVAGKTFGTNNDSYLWVRIGQFTATTTNTSLDIWGVQLEAGSVATQFATATGTKQGEKSACQRYYWRATALGSNDAILPTGTALSTTQVIIHGFHPTSMRTYTSSFDFSNIRLFDGVTVFAVTAVTSSFTNPDTYALILTCAGGLTQFRPYVVLANSGTSYFGANAEL